MTSDAQTPNIFLSADSVFFLSSVDPSPRSDDMGPWSSFDTMPRESRSTASISRDDRDCSFLSARFNSACLRSSALVCSFVMAGTAPMK